MDDRERLAVLSLWAVPGIGPKALGLIRDSLAGEWSIALDHPPGEWMSGVRLSAPVRQRLGQVRRLADLGDRLLERANRAKIGVAFPGDLAYPENLAAIEDRPPVLFFRGSVGVPRRRVALVGSRHPDPGFLRVARRFAARLAELGLGVVSGAAEGVDRACHFGAMDMGGETWAFLGSALDQLDPALAKFVPHVLDRGGVAFSELPCGVRASPATFPRRNRLIAGASDTVCVLRAGQRSGALYTAVAALKQRRPLWAVPADLGNEAGSGCNALIRAGYARLCAGPEDLAASAGAGKGVLLRSEGRARGKPDLSVEAGGVLRATRKVPQSFEELLAATSLEPGKLLSALCELELMGLVVQLPGKCYEKV